MPCVAIFVRDNGPAIYACHSRTRQQHENLCFTAIWNSITTGQFKARFGLSSSQYQQAWEQATGAGLLTRAVTGCQQGNKVRYAAVWRK